jgi:hypothetical protein
MESGGQNTASAAFITNGTALRTVNILGPEFGPASIAMLSPTTGLGITIGVRASATGRTGIWVSTLSPDGNLIAGPTKSAFATTLVQISHPYPGQSGFSLQGTGFVQTECD